MNLSSLCGSGGNSVGLYGNGNKHIFTSSGTFSDVSNQKISILLVNGGQGGVGRDIANTQKIGGEGGAGSPITLIPDVYVSNNLTVTVGAGGTYGWINDANRTGGISSVVEQGSAVVKINFTNRHFLSSLHNHMFCEPSADGGDGAGSSSQAEPGDGCGIFGRGGTSPHTDLTNGPWYGGGGGGSWEHGQDFNTSSNGAVGYGGGGSGGWADGTNWHHAGNAGNGIVIIFW